MSPDTDQTPTSPRPYAELNPEQKKQRLQELAFVFLKLGAIAFGGPAAHIAMMNEEVVKRRQWLEADKLLDLLGVTNLIPGPNSTELAIHVGFERAGWRGLLIAGSCFILPAMLMVWTLAALYARYQTVPEVGWLLYGIKPVIIAVIAQALWKLGRAAVKNLQTALAGLAVIGCFWIGVNEILLLFVAGLAVMLYSWQPWSRGPTASALLPIPILTLVNGPSSGVVRPATWAGVFLFFLKVGSVLYGSGYVLLAFLERDLVERSQWLTSEQLLDAVAIGQFTPGPVFTTATFIGYLLAGNAGAIAATIGIFLPAFVLIALVNPWVPRLRSSAWASGFLDGVNAASLGLMAVVTWQLGVTALVDWLTLLLAILSFAAVFQFRVNSAWLVGAGGLVGFLSKSL